MPKNPVRAARQASRQAVRSAKTANRQDARTMRTAAKVEKITAKTANKIAKLNAAAPKRAASEPMEKIEAKGMTKIATPASSGLVKSTAPRSMSEVAKGMKPNKKSGSSKPKGPKTPTPKEVSEKVIKTGKRTADAVRRSIGGRPAPENSNVPESLKVFERFYNPDASYTDNMTRRLRENKYYESDKRAKEELNKRRAERGLPPKKNGGGVKKKYGMGGGMKGKKC